MKPDPAREVSEWWSAQESTELFITSITVAELLLGNERLPIGKRRSQLGLKIEETFELDFPRRILPFDEEAARHYATLVAQRAKIGRPISQSDAMIASIAASNQAAIATRNVADFQHCGIKVINPWVAAAAFSNRTMSLKAGAKRSAARFSFLI